LVIAKHDGSCIPIIATNKFGPQPKIAKGKLINFFRVRIT